MWCIYIFGVKGFENSLPRTVISNLTNNPTFQSESSGACHDISCITASFNLHSLSILNNEVRLLLAHHKMTRPNLFIWLRKGQHPRLHVHTGRTYAHHLHSESLLQMGCSSCLKLRSYFAATTMVGFVILSLLMQLLSSFSSNSTMEEQLKQRLKGRLLQPGDVIFLPPHHPQRRGLLNCKARKVFEKPAKFGTERFVSLSLLDLCCCVQLCSMLLKEWIMHEPLALKLVFEAVATSMISLIFVHQLLIHPNSARGKQILEGSFNINLSRMKRITFDVERKRVTAEAGTSRLQPICLIFKELSFRLYLGGFRFSLCKPASWLSPHRWDCIHNWYNLTSYTCA